MSTRQNWGDLSRRDPWLRVWPAYARVYIPLRLLSFESFGKPWLVARTTCSSTEIIRSGTREHDKINMFPLSSLFCSTRCIISFSSFLAEFASRRHRLNFAQVRLPASWLLGRDRCATGTKNPPKSFLVSLERSAMIVRRLVPAVR